MVLLKFFHENCAGDQEGGETAIINSEWVYIFSADQPLFMQLEVITLTTNPDRYSCGRDQRLAKLWGK